MSTVPDFAQRVLAWHAADGRHDLPWQQDRTPYRVWLSEVMLQQTTVATVRDYYARFLSRFPEVQDLAAAPLDEVLSLWQGLGYYARARNLHACAQQVVLAHDGEFPTSREALEQLPGIGRSTAAAICAQAYGQPEAILDANVKRLLTRHNGITEWPGRSAVHRQLWTIAEDLLPTSELANYTQGLMDLGAQICKPRQPLCTACPLADDCIALRDDLTRSIPARAPRKNKRRPHRHCRMWIQLRDDGAIWLQKRPPVGIWGGLWCLPQSEPGDTPHPEGDLPTLKHVFSHFDLSITPLIGTAPADHIAEGAEGTWVHPDDIESYGLPTAVHRILATLHP